MVAARLAKLAVLLAVLVAAGCETAPEKAPPMAAPPPPAPAPVAPMAAAPPAPPEAKQPRAFLVFFDLNKTTLSADARRVIREAAAEYRSFAPVDVVVTGHTDLSGSARYNKALSLRRARTVRAALRREGVPANRMTVMGRGESQPAFVTPDGVTEPQNRRAEIKLR